LINPIVTAATTIWRDAASAGSRALPEETAIAVTYGRETFAVMMASPQDLEDFALGFSLSESIIESQADITSLDIFTLPLGIECRMELTHAKRDALAARRRRIAGPVGCGLCGMDSLEQALRPAKPVPHSLRLSASEIAGALSRLPKAQTLNQATRAVHAAALYTPGAPELLVREDVGRHNALDKLIGAATIAGRHGIILLTSRVSIELIQKAAIFGAEILAAVSVPSARAVRDAEQAGITLIAVARDDGFEIFTHPERIILK